MYYSVVCAQWSSTKTQLSLGCHPLALAPCGLFSSRAVLSFISLPRSFQSLPVSGVFSSFSFLPHQRQRQVWYDAPLLPLDTHCAQDPKNQAAPIAWQREDPQQHTSSQAGEQGVCSVRKHRERHRCAFISSETHSKKKNNPQEGESFIDDICLSEL